MSRASVKENRKAHRYSRSLADWLQRLNRSGGSGLLQVPGHIGVLPCGCQRSMLTTKKERRQGLRVQIRGQSWCCKSCDRVIGQVGAACSLRPAASSAAVVIDISNSDGGLHSVESASPSAVSSGRLATSAESSPPM